MSEFKSLSELRKAARARMLKGLRDWEDGKDVPDPREPITATPVDMDKIEAIIANARKARGQ